MPATSLESGAAVTRQAQNGSGETCGRLGGALHHARIPPMSRESCPNIGACLDGGFG